MMNFEIKRETFYCFCLSICFLLVLKAFTWIYTGQGVYILDVETSRYMRIHSVFTYLVIACLVFLNWKYFFCNNMLINVSFVFSFFLLSAFWAYDIKESLRMSVSVFFQILIAVSLCRNASFHIVLDRLVFVSKVILWLNVIFIIFFSGYAFEDGYFDGSYEGALRGIFSSKNIFGAVMSFCYSIFLVKMYCNVGRGSVGICFYFLISLVMVVFSMSATSIISILGSSFIVCFFSSSFFCCLDKSKKFIALFLMIFLGVIFLFLLEPVLSLMGRDLSFTGRTILWEFSLNAYYDKPFLGYGLNSFWREMLHLDLLVEEGMWNVGQAHNGFLDAFLAGGILGGGIVLYLYLKMIFLSFYYLVKRKTDFTVVMLLLFLWISIIQNLTETSFPYGMRITGTVITLFFIFSFFMSKENIKIKG